jgi:hypothetical protein
MVTAVLLCTAGLAFMAIPAMATFHEMSIREVYAGSADHPESKYVELQMWRSAQNFVGGHTLLVYSAGGALVKENALAADVPGDANQSTILIATPQAAEQFGITADETLSPASQIDPSGGAICWQEIDCVSWGSFDGGSLPSPAGSAAPAIPDSMALRRTISPGCPTLLEPTDDRDNSAADFSPVSPSPRPNSVAPVERPCGSPGGQPGGGSTGGGQGDTGAPRTTLTRKPARKTHDRTPTFRFSSDEIGSSFECKLDGKAFRPCRSPFTARKLSVGRHRFKVRARDESGRLDPSPAAYGFAVTAKTR